MPRKVLSPSVVLFAVLHAVLFPFFDSLSDLVCAADETLLELKLDPEMLVISMAARMLSQD